MKTSLREIAKKAEQGAEAAAGLTCFHCGLPCLDREFIGEERAFCCQGCKAVCELLTATGLDRFYDIAPSGGLRVSGRDNASRWDFLDEPETRDKLLDFTNGRMSRVTFYVPAIHCVACVWLLENLFRLDAGIGQSTVHFPRREVSITFDCEKIRLSRLVAMLSSIGYEPQLTLGELEKRGKDSVTRTRWVQTGLAGFAFGNIMLVSLPLYIGLDSFSGPFLHRLFGWLSLLMALPVLIYSASDYWKSAWLSFQQRALTLDVPIAVGLVAIYGQSAYEILSGTGGGYLDSFCGLIFFLLCGRIFQQKTHDRIAFDRDYRSFFPLSATRRTPAGEEAVPISNIIVGDRLIVRNGEIAPADGRVLNGEAKIDYSFVTGEAEPVTLSHGARIYAGGRQTGGAVEIETLKPVSQSYLTSLWGHHAFAKRAETGLQSLTNIYSRRFTVVVLAVAMIAVAGWLCLGEPSRALKSFISVLIVACPCALALAAPFTVGAAQRVLARLQIFVRNPLVLERMGEVNTVVFDKTGTLTTRESPSVQFLGATHGVGDEAEAIAKMTALASHSTHPLSAVIAESVPGARSRAGEVVAFREVAGRGLYGRIDQDIVLLGSARWLTENGVSGMAALAVTEKIQAASSVHGAINGAYVGTFSVNQTLREDADAMLQRLKEECDLALLSGDNERERKVFQQLFGPCAALHFNRNPVQKLEWIESLKSDGKRVVMMVGDGLNDAGALRASDVGVAVVDRIGAFSPASDVVMEASQVRRMSDLLKFSRQTVRIVRLSFRVSAVYNVIGIAIAAAGILSPVVCAVLMPLSSVSVVAFSCGMVSRSARKLDLQNY